MVPSGGNNFNDFSKKSTDQKASSFHLAISGAFYMPLWTLSKQMFHGGRQVFRWARPPRASP